MSAHAEERGFSLVELLIAVTVGLVAITCIVLVGDTLVGGELDSELAERASGALGKMQAAAIDDFHAVNSYSQVAGAYIDEAVVKTLPDFVTKVVRARAKFVFAYGDQESVVATLVTNQDNIRSPDTCFSDVSGDWAHPSIVSYPLMSLIGTTTGPYTVSDVDAFFGRLYVASDRRAYKTDPALHVLAVSAGVPALEGKLPTTWAATQGLSALRVVNGPTSAQRYIFGASKTASQLQVIDVSTPAAPVLSLSRAVTGGAGNSISYYNGFVYLGLAAQTGAPELYVFDAHSPVSATQIGKWPPSGSIGAAVNAVFERGRYVYLAHGPTAAYAEQISVLNILTPATPYHVSGYLAPAASTFPNSGNGKSVLSIGNMLYLGRTQVNKVGVPQFLIEDASRPFALPPVAAGSAILIPDASINKIIIRSTYAYLLTNKALLVYNISNPTAPALVANTALPSFGGSTEPSMDCEGNTIFVGSNDASNIGTITVITAS